MNQTNELAHDHENKSPTPAEIVGWLEFGCWTIVVLTPFIYWANGPAVSTDQSVVRAATVALALTGGIAIRMVKWIRGKSNRK